MLRSLKLGDYLYENPPTVSRDTNLYEAVSIITDNKMSGICVVEEDGTLVGILSEMDCLRAVLDDVYNEDSRVGPVEDYMSTDLATAGPHYDAVSVAADMLKRGHRRRPVVKDGKLIGVASCRRLLQAFKDFNYNKTIS